MIHILSCFVILSICSVQCCPNTFIRKNVRNAEKQIASLVDAAESDGNIRIPSTFRNGFHVFVPAEDWVSGFFAGSLWYMYELTGDEQYAEKARRHTEVLHDIQYLTSNHDVGFMIGCSYGNGLRLKDIPGYDTVIVNAARSLSTRFRPGAGIIQSWDTDQGNWISLKGWTCPVIIDNMMNLELLFMASEITGDDIFARIAVSHADKTMKHHFREDGSTYHVVDYDDVTGEVLDRCTAQGIADESRWARGQAWALYGFTSVFRWTSDVRYLEMAESVAEYLLEKEDNMPEDLVPLWDFDVREYAAYDEDMKQYEDQRDVSSAAIISSALYELYFHTGKELYKENADRMIESLSGPPYMAEAGTNGGFILKHSVGSLPHGGNVDVPLNYADYYYLEALARKKGCGAY